VTDLDVSQFVDADAPKFVELVKSTPKAELESLLASDARGQLLDAVFNRMPGQFRPDKAGSASAVIHWNITGRPDGGADTYELVIADGACTLSPAPQAEPKLTFSLGGYDFLQLIAGAANPMMLFMTGKVKAKGDLGLAANIANYFDLPKA
jgi:putative sterol carrier protein